MIKTRYIIVLAVNKTVDGKNEEKQFLKMSYLELADVTGVKAQQWRRRFLKKIVRHLKTLKQLTDDLDMPLVKLFDFLIIA